MESYEKAYKAMVQRARELHEGGNALTKLQMEIVCPELKDSEDERVIKWLLGICKNMAHACRLDLAIDTEDAGLKKELANYEASILYLEKKKEQKSEQSETEKEYVRTLHSLIADFLRGKQEIDREYYQKIWDWLDNRHIEQKPDIEICPHSIKSKSYSEQKPESCDPDTNVEKVIEEVICVYGKTQGEWIGGYDIDMLIVNLRRAFNMKSQKPAEWSKEEFEIFRKTLAKDAFLDEITSKRVAKKLLNSVKSLRPSWKPSEEQMDALEYFVQKHKTEANAATCVWQDYENLVSLRNDLKKL